MVLVFPRKMNWPANPLTRNLQIIPAVICGARKSIQKAAVDNELSLKADRCIYPSD